MRVLKIYRASCVYCVSGTPNRCRIAGKSSCFACRSYSEPIEGLSTPENLQQAEHRRRNKLAAWESTAVWLALVLSVFNLFIESIGKEWWLRVLNGSR